METIYNPYNKEDLEALSNKVDIKQEVLSESIKRCIAAKEKAYCKYSNFRVGAAVVLKDGTIYDGCNVENISYGLTICAERTTICSSICNGVNIKDFHCVVCTTDKEEFLTPCGACRQFISEFEEFKHVICVNNKGLCKVATVKELIPFVFKTDL